jgi:hypothetical protein
MMRKEIHLEVLRKIRKYFSRDTLSLGSVGSVSKRRRFLDLNILVLLEATGREFIRYSDFHSQNQLI